MDPRTRRLDNLGRAQSPQPHIDRRCSKYSKLARTGYVGKLKYYSTQGECSCYAKDNVQCG